MRKLSRTCSSCLLSTVFRILSCSSWSVSGCSVCRRWYDNVGLRSADRALRPKNPNPKIAQRDVHEPRRLVRRIVHHREINVEHADLHAHPSASFQMGVQEGRCDTHELGVRVNSFRDTLACERLLAEAPLDVVQHLGVRGVRLVEHVLQREVRRPEAVAEVLREDPAAVCAQQRARCERGRSHNRSQQASEKGRGYE